jgi:hypothetical protein
LVVERQKVRDAALDHALVVVAAMIAATDSSSR